MLTDKRWQFRLLMGPADKQDPELFKLGFNPASAYEVVENIRRDPVPFLGKGCDQPIGERRVFADQWRRREGED